MSTGRILWEHPIGDEMLRLAIIEHRGKSKADIRIYYRSDGGWKHSARGCAVPLEALSILASAMNAWDSEKP